VFTVKLFSLPLRHRRAIDKDARKLCHISKVATSKTKPPRTRLSAGERERAIGSGGRRVLLEAGFGGQKHGSSAKRLGITQPLLYRYFRTKKPCDRSIRRFYLNRWDPPLGKAGSRPIPSGARTIIAFTSLTRRPSSAMSGSASSCLGLRGMNLRQPLPDAGARPHLHAGDSRAFAASTATTARRGGDQRARVRTVGLWHATFSTSGFGSGSTVSRSPSTSTP